MKPDVRGESGQLIWADGKATIPQITTCDNQGMQKSIFERTTRETLKQMGYSNKQLWLQFTWDNRKL